LVAAKDLGEGNEITEEEAAVMIWMADKNENNGVDLEDYIALMKELGLITKCDTNNPDPIDEDPSAFKKNPSESLVESHILTSQNESKDRVRAGMQIIEEK